MSQEVSIINLTLKSNEKFQIKKQKLDSISIDNFEKQLNDYLNLKFKNFNDLHSANVTFLDKVTVIAEIKNKKQKFFSKKICKFEDSIDFIISKLRKIFIVKKTRQIAFEHKSKIFKSKIKEVFGKTILDIDIPKKLYQIPYSSYTPVDIVHINYASLQDLNYYRNNEEKHLKLLKNVLYETEETKHYFAKNKIDYYQKLILKNNYSKFYLNKRTMTVNTKVNFLFLDIIFDIRIEEIF